MHADTVRSFIVITLTNKIGDCPMRDRNYGRTWLPCPPMRVLADETRMAELLGNLADAISQNVAAGADAPIAIVGIRSRGDILATRLAESLKPDHVGTLDITLYRDDLSEVTNQPVVRTTEIPFAIDGLDVVLVDDVIMSGRSIRAALQSLMDLGRPRRVWLSVLVDRGQRELPIQPDFVALDLSGRADRRSSADSNEGRGGGRVDEAVQPDELVAVHIRPTDAEDAIIVVPSDEAMSMASDSQGGGAL